MCHSDGVLSVQFSDINNIHIVIVMYPPQSVPSSFPSTQIECALVLN